MTAATTPSRMEKLILFVQFILAVLFVFFVVEKIANAFPSTLLLVGIGVVYSPILDLLFSKWTPSDRYPGEGYLGFKFPFLPLLMTSLFALIAAGLIAESFPDITSSAKLAFMSGLFLWIAASQFVLWLKIRKMSTINE